MRNALQRADPQHTRLLIENNAGTGGCVGARFEEIRAMIDAVGDDRVRSCFDTCHAFASGYDLRTEADARRVIDDWDRVVGLDRLDAIHCNDSQTGLGSNRDRHQNIGLGEIGEEGFRALLHDPRLDEGALHPRGPRLRGPRAGRGERRDPAPAGGLVTPACRGVELGALFPQRETRIETTGTMQPRGSTNAYSCGHSTTRARRHPTRHRYPCPLSNVLAPDEAPHGVSHHARGPRAQAVSLRPPLSPLSSSCRSPRSGPRSPRP